MNNHILLEMTIDFVHSEQLFVHWRIQNIFLGGGGGDNFSVLQISS